MRGWRTLGSNVDLRGGFSAPSYLKIHRMCYDQQVNPALLCCTGSWEVKTSGRTVAPAEARCRRASYGEQKPDSEPWRTLQGLHIPIPQEPTHRGDFTRRRRLDGAGCLCTQAEERSRRTCRHVADTLGLLEAGGVGLGLGEGTPLQQQLPEPRELPCPMQGVSTAGPRVLW